MTSAMPQEPQWVTSLLTKRANKPLMAFEDSRKAATSTGWKARRFWEKRDTTHYAHNALQQMGVPKGHVLYDRLHKSLTEGVNLAEVTKTGLIEHLGLAQQLRSAEMQLTMDDILSIYILVCHPCPRTLRMQTADHSERVRSQESWIACSPGLQSLRTATVVRCTRSWALQVLQASHPPHEALPTGNVEGPSPPALHPPRRRLRPASLPPWLRQSWALVTR